MQAHSCSGKVHTTQIASWQKTPDLSKEPFPPPNCSSGVSLITKRSSKALYQDNFLIAQKQPSHVHLSAVLSENLVLHPGPESGQYLY